MATPGRPQRHISGPQSALTDFLAAHNISANQIRLDAAQRREDASRSLREDGSAVNADGSPSNNLLHDGDAAAPTQAQKLKRKAKEKKAIEKIKASRAFKNLKYSAQSSDDDEEIAAAIFEKTRAPLPGQLDNCGICGKRFTVTPYSGAGPDGKLLCASCSREINKDQSAKKAKTRRTTAGVGYRRTIQSRILDGTFTLGAKSLVTLCVETLVKNVDLADNLGDLPPHQVDRIARHLSKRRLLNPRTLQLFVLPSTQSLSIYDGAYLGEQDLLKFMQVASELSSLKIRCAIQFKDSVMEYLLSRGITLKSLYLHGANLLSNRMWTRFLREKGTYLKTLQVYFTDKHFGNDIISILHDTCPNLERLKILHNQAVTSNGVEKISKLSGLKHLSLRLRNVVPPNTLVGIMSQIGERLETFSLRDVPKMNNQLLDAIHTHCRQLKKLRITDSEEMTDEGFVNLFTDWDNPPLEYVDFQKCRHLDAAEPRINSGQIGLCSGGFLALMAHSRKSLKTVNAHACRHISREAFEAAFGESKTYPDLEHIEISFCEQVTPFVMGCIFRTCPRLRTINVFGCMKVKDKEIQVPPTVNVVGGANAYGFNLG